MLVVLDCLVVAVTSDSSPPFSGRAGVGM